MPFRTEPDNPDDALDALHPPLPQVRQRGLFRQQPFGAPPIDEDAPNIAPQLPAPMRVVPASIGNALGQVGQFAVNPGSDNFWRDAAALTGQPLPPSLQPATAQPVTERMVRSTAPPIPSPPSSSAMPPLMGPPEPERRPLAVRADGQTDLADLFPGLVAGRPTVPEVWNGFAFTNAQSANPPLPQYPGPVANPNWGRDERNPANRFGVGAPTPEQFGASVIGSDVRWFPGSDAAGYRAAQENYRLNNAQSRQDQLASDIARGYQGPNGFIQGTIANAAWDRSPEGIAIQQEQRLLESLVGRTDLSPEEIGGVLREIRRLRSSRTPQGVSGSAGVSGTPPSPSQGSQSPGNVVVENGNETPLQQMINRNLNIAMGSFQESPNATGGIRTARHRILPGYSPEATAADRARYQQAISSYLGQFNDDDLRANYDQIMQALSSRLNAPAAFRDWWTSQEPVGTVETWRNSNTPDAMRIQQIRRLESMLPTMPPRTGTMMGIPVGQVPPGFARGNQSLFPLFTSVYRTGDFPMTLPPLPRR